MAFPPFETMISLKNLAVLIMFIVVVKSGLCFANVYELNKDSLEEFRQEKLLVVIFVDSPTCERCRIQYPFFVATSQAFPSDPEIFFVRVHDPRFITEWGITELPALMYYRRGIEEPDFFTVDITVDDIIDEIARRLHSNFGSLKRYYAVELNPQIFQEIVKTPKQSVLLLAYDKNSSKQLTAMEHVAKVFRNDDAILITKLNVDKHRELRDREFKSRDVPAVFWYKVGEKQVPKRFGGHISLHMETTFINEQTGLNRNVDGSLKPTSGRIAKHDTRVLEHADGILNRDKKEIGNLATRLTVDNSQLNNHELDFGDYYVFLLEKMKASGSLDILHIQMDDINRKLDEHEDMLQKQEDFLKRKRNILHFFLNLQKESDKFREQQRRKREQERRRKEEEKRKKAEQEKKAQKKGARADHTAKATVHRRVHEEL